MTGDTIQYTYFQAQSREGITDGWYVAHTATTHPTHTRGNIHLSGFYNVRSKESMY